MIEGGQALTPPIRTAHQIKLSCGVPPIVGEHRQDLVKMLWRLAYLVMVTADT